MLSHTTVGRVAWMTTCRKRWPRKRLPTRQPFLRGAPNPPSRARERDDISHSDRGRRVSWPREGELSFLPANQSRGDAAAGDVLAGSCWSDGPSIHRRRRQKRLLHCDRRPSCSPVAEGSHSPSLSLTSKCVYTRPTATDRPKLEGL